MARIVFQNREWIVPEGEVDASQLYQELAVPPNRNLVLVRPDRNELLARQGKVRPADGDRFVDAPTFIYG